MENVQADRYVLDGRKFSFSAGIDVSQTNSESSTSRACLLYGHCVRSDFPPTDRPSSFDSAL